MRSLMNDNEIEKLMNVERSLNVIDRSEMEAMNFRNSTLFP
jgi:hypothetical protein